MITSRFHKSSLVVLAFFGICFQQCSKQSEDSSSGIEAGFYVAEANDNYEIPMVSFFVVEDKLTSFEFKKITWQNGSNYGVFGKGGNVRNYSAGPVPGSTSAKASGQPTSIQESTIYYPIDADHVRAELTKSQATPVFSEIKNYTLKRVSAQEFKARFKLEISKLILSNSELQPGSLSKEQTDYCQTNFSQTCLEASK